jgi:hypothetical protein
MMRATEAVGNSPLGQGLGEHDDWLNDAFEAYLTFLLVVEKGDPNRKDLPRDKMQRMWEGDQ